MAERCRVEQAPRESEERFRQLAEHITDVFWAAEPRPGEVLDVSPVYEMIWVRPCRGLYEDRHSDLESVHPEDGEGPGLHGAPGP